MDTKKIAIVIAELAAPGGAEKVAVDLAEEFERRGYQVTIITFDEPPPPDQALHPVGKRIRVNLPQKVGGMMSQSWLVLQRAYQFRKIFQREKFDCIFSFLEAANVPAVLASAKTNVSMHLNPEVLTKKEWFIVRYLYPRANKVIAVSQHMQAQLQKKAYLTNAICIYNPVVIDNIKTLALEPINIASDPFILAVGRLSKQKRFDRLINAYANSKLVKKVKLFIIGDGNEYANLEQLIAQLGLADHILLLGYQANPYCYMQKAHYLVMSSDYEGYPLTLIESLTLGCPVISTDCPTGPREIIQHGENGLLVALNDESALAAAMNLLFTDELLWQRLKDNAPQSVNRNDIKIVADAWLAN